MFTIKFYKNNPNDALTRVCISAIHYQVIEESDYCKYVTVYKQFSQENGTTYIVSDNPDEYDICYVENQTGKTIDVISLKK